MTAAVLSTTERAQPLVKDGKPALVALSLVAFWGVVGLLAAVADFSEQAGAPGHPFSDKLKLYGAVFLPFALFSMALALAFDRFPSLLRPWRLAALYLAALLFALPLYGLYETAAVLTLAHKPLPGLVDMLAQPTAWNRWLDALMLTMALAVQGAYAWWQHGQRQARRSRAAERANVALRLSLLQGQLEPAFLLSALGGIADLVLHAERSQATRALARLADLLRHALRASSHDWISVADEIAFVRDYVALQVLRFGPRVQVEWELGQVNWQEAQCPPLLLHALLDHAIARCLETTAAAGPVHVSFALAAGRVLAIVSHPLGAGPVEPGAALDETRARLALLYQGGATLAYSAVGARVYGALTLPSREGSDD
jgi:two-component system sensor histidine kinase AlgZ